MSSSIGIRVDRKTVEARSDLEDDQLTRAVLGAVHRNHSITQRSVADEVGIALGLANAYLKRCINKGYIKINQAPKNRYLYYLTPEGFAAKLRLTTEYLSQSLVFFRAAREQCEAVLQECGDKGWRRVALAGAGDLAEIAILSARDFKGDLVAVIEGGSAQVQFHGLPVAASPADVPMIDGILITDQRTPQATYEAMCAALGEDRVAVLPLLGVLPMSQAQSQ